MTTIELMKVLGNLGEFFGAIAVVVSLVFLVSSVKQNTQALRSNTLHDVKETFREVNLIWAENGELARIMFEGLQNPAGLAGVERVRFYTSVHNLFLGYENLFLQKQSGALSPEHWSGMEQHMIDALKLPGLQTWWGDRKQWFTKDFQIYIEERAIPTPAHPKYKMMGT